MSDTRFMVCETDEGYEILDTVTNEYVDHIMFDNRDIAQGAAEIWNKMEQALCEDFDAWLELDPPPPPAYA